MTRHAHAPTAQDRLDSACARFNAVYDRIAQGTAPAILPPARRTVDAQERAEAEAARLDAMRHGAAPFAILTRPARVAFAS